MPMLINAIADIIDNSGCVANFWGKLDKGEDASLGIVSSARPLFVAACFARDPKPTLVVLPGEDAAWSFSRVLASYLGEDAVLTYPLRTDRPHLEEPADPIAIAKRAMAADALRKGRHVVVVASSRSLIRDITPPDEELSNSITLKTGMELEPLDDFDDGLDALVHMLEYRGYENTGELDGPGTFSSHGGTIDVFPGNLDFPIRIDFFGDEIEEIRRVVPSTGQMISSLDEVDIYSVSEMPLDSKAINKAAKKLEKAALTNKALRDALEKLDGGLRFDGAEILMPFFYSKTSSIGSYIGKDALTCIIEPRAIFDDMVNAYQEIEESFKGTYLNPEGIYTQPAKMNFGHGVQATYMSIMQLGASVDDEVPVKRVGVARSMEKLFGKMRNWLDGGNICLFSAPSYRVRKDIELEFVDNSLPIQERLDSIDPYTAPLKSGVVNIVDVDIPLGMVIPKAKLVMLSLEDLKGARQQTHERRKTDITDITFPYSPGDYVVHEIYGIAYFKGMVLREVDGVERDYLELDYAEGDKLFLPVEQFDKVTRYVGPEGHTPKITRLDSTDWSRAITRARKATRALAFDLIEVYSRRSTAKGYKFHVETPWMTQMEEEFPFEETPDQLAAIEDVKADMKSDHPMDRLICGDVGFGKTEVAVRAAFIAAQNKKQVMVLCPTTILAQQHYTSFTERLDGFDMRVEVISRFSSPAKQKQILEDFAQGKVDVLIGTHRLLSRDVNPSDLGLVIIDEEQRFGVSHKEQFKNLREYVDILTLSATPIPRTMQMAVSGVRDLSLILTPPRDRLPVKVHVGEWDPDIVSAAIRQELARHGQVYYVSNRVKTIEEALDRVREAAPEARVGMAHGKMSKEQLEAVMEDFSAGEIDVLVATTIIESGIDNPHTNTLIIEDSQRLGLSQMYQLKGRVGRSNEQAYAYFMFPEEIPLTEDAQARLEALSEESDLGSGMRIAMRDLEIRGAGNLLGAEQSGNMSAVGFDLFSQMLNQAVVDAREGEGVVRPREKSASDVTVNIPGHMYISGEYVPDINERVLWYRRISSATTEDDLYALEHDMASVYPDMPQATINLFEKERLRAFAGEHGATNITISGGNLSVEGIEISKAQMIPLKRKGARYIPDKKKLIAPLKKIDSIDVNDEKSLASSITNFLHGIYNESESEIGDE